MTCLLVNIASIMKNINSFENPNNFPQINVYVLASWFGFASKIVDDLKMNQRTTNPHDVLFPFYIPT